MATVTFPWPALNRSVLHVLGTTSLHRGRPVTDAWMGLTGDLDDREAAALPISIGLALPLLAGDRERLRLAADVAVTFDLFEVATFLVKLLDDVPDPELALAAAALAANPGVPGGVITSLRDRQVVRELAAGRRRAFDLRLDPAARIETDLEALLLAQRWPGRRNSAQTVRPPGPTIAVDSSAGDPSWVLTLLSALHERGASVRRLPRDAARSVPAGWLGPSTPVVAASATTISKLKQWGQPVTGAQLVAVDLRMHPDRSLRKPLSLDRSLREVIDSVAQLLPEDAALLPVPVDREPAVANAPLDKGTFTLGSFNAQETAFLAAGVRNDVYRWSRELDALKPRKVEGFSYWRFNQLVALRTYGYLRNRSRGHISPRVITALAEFGGRQQGTEVAVTAAGDVLEVTAAGLHELLSGQGAFHEVVRLDDVFEPFMIGGGRSLPGLLAPGSHARVHPGVLGGSPVLQGHRIACKTLARLAETRGVPAVRDAYPSLDSDHVTDAIAVGRKLLNTR